MIRQLPLILIILALAGWGGWTVLHTTVPAKPAEEAEARHETPPGKEIRLELKGEKLKNAELKIDEPAPATILTLLPLYGKLCANEEALMHGYPRFAGTLREVRKKLGDHVEKGDTLAVVESNQSLRTYEMKSELAGTIIQKHAVVGEYAKEDEILFTVADLSTVWVDLSVFRQDFARLKDGQRVWIHLDDNGDTLESRISYISPFGAESTQTMLARAVVENPKGDLRPGLFVTAEVATGEVHTEIAVRAEAIQVLKEKSVVFIQDGDGFIAREVTLGTRDAEHVQVLKGLKAGEKYVSENSFILKAEIGKADAEDE